MSEYPNAARAGVSPNRSPRQGKVKLFIVHHYAGTQDPESAWRRFNAPNDRSVSPNYQVNADGSVYEVVPPDRFRAWTTGAIDHQAVTCETQNASGAPSWAITRESHEAIAHLIAWASQRYGFPIQRGRVADGNVVTVPGVVGHRETPAGRQTSTACPGPSMDLDWLVERARQIAGGSPAGGESREWDEMATKEEVKAALRDVLNESGPGVNQTTANVAFLAGQANGWIATDRPAEGQLATAISRVTEILFAIDGRADPRIKNAEGEPVKRAIAAFLESRPEAPSSGVDIDETAIVEGVLAGLASDLDALVTVVKALPAETVAALKAAL